MEVFKFGFRQWKKRLALDILTKLLSFTALTADLLLPLLTAMFINYVIKEEQPEQKTVIVLSGVMFLAAFIVAGLNFRFGWIVLQNWIVYAATAVFLLGYILYAEVLRENAYLSRTVEIQENQKVIDTGLYGIVRHPMYMSTFLLFLSMPLVLGSVISFVIMLVYIPIIAKRIRNEEQVLEEGLAGYSDYKKQVKYKVIPYVW